MNVEDLLTKINTFKAEHPACTFELSVERVIDLDDLYGELYLFAFEESNPTESVDDELLLTIEKPTKEDFAQLEEIAEALKKFV